jgi:hypothetical protein
MQRLVIAPLMYFRCVTFIFLLGEPLIYSINIQELIFTQLLPLEETYLLIIEQALLLERPVELVIM